MEKRRAEAQMSKLKVSINVQREKQQPFDLAF
jgi:hypothetical protein